MHFCSIGIAFLLCTGFSLDTGTISANNKTLPSWASSSCKEDMDTASGSAVEESQGEPREWGSVVSSGRPFPSGI